MGTRAKAEGYFIVTVSGQIVISTVTSINTDNSDPIHYLYPNPTDGLFTIVAKGVKGSVIISVINEAGQEVYLQKIQHFNESYQINFSRLPKGIYRVSLVRSEGSLHYRLVLQ